MNRAWRVILTIGILALVGWLAWYFSTLLVYIIIAVVLSFLGQPLVGFFDRLRIGKFHLPHSLASFLALIMVLGGLLLLVALFVPMIVYEANLIANIDFNALNKNLQGPIHNLNHFLVNYGLIKHGEKIDVIALDKLHSMLDFSSFTGLFTDVISLTGSLYIGLFSVVFISFFFIKDEKMFHNSVLLLSPSKYQEEVSRIMLDSRHMLSRYFLGLCLDILIMSTMLAVGLWIAGVENALLIGFLGGMMNVIPYLGPLIGGGIGILLALSAALSAGVYSGLGLIMLKVTLVFIIGKTLDDIIFQPFIFSNSVKAHPLEIFMVIMMAGTVAGIWGMILAIPAYTVIRIIAREFLSRFRLVQKITEHL